MNSPCVNCGAEAKVCKDCDWYNGIWMPKDQYEARLKAEKLAMIEELDLQIDEIGLSTQLSREDIYWNMGAKAMRKKIKDLIQEKINALRGNKGDEKVNN